MNPPNEQSTNSGQTQKNEEKQSSRASRAKKISDAPDSEKPEIPSKTGSASPLTTKNSSENESESSSKNKRGPKKKSSDKPPAPQFQLQVDRKAAALKRLGLSQEQVNQAPQITPLLKNAKGGLKALLGAMRFATDDEDISNFLEKYDSIPVGDLEHTSWEAIAISAGVNLRHLLGAVQLAAATYFGNTSKMIAVTSHPSITKARVKYGLLPSGEKDRNALDVMVGALPSAKGPTFIGKAVFGGSTSAQSTGPVAESDDDDEPEVVGTFTPDDDIDDLFPPANGMQEKLNPIRQRLLKD